MASLHSPTHAGPIDFPMHNMLQWNKCDIPAPQKMSSPIDAAVYNDTAYFRPYRSRKIYSYNLTSGWSVSADCLVRDCSLVVLPVPYKRTDQLFLLHTIGGIKRKNHRQNDDEEEDEEEFTADISQLTNSAPGEWTRSIYPKLTTKRSQVTVVFSNGCLIVAGGNSAHGIIQTVDVLIVTYQNKLSWHEVASLPYKVFRASGCVCDDMLYLLGGYVVRDGDIVPTRNACVATVSKLAHSHTDDKIFKKIRNLEFKTSACVSFRNHVLAIGGWKFNTETGQQKGTKLVHVYHTRADAWKKLEGQLPRPRCLGFAAAFKDKIMTVGGYNRPNGICTDSVAFATIPSDEPKQVCQALLLPSDTDPQASCQRKRSSLASDAHEMDQLEDFLKRYNSKNMALGMLDRKIEKSEFGVLASNFANVALFIEDMRLTPAEKGDVNTLVSSHGNQMAMLKCFEAWRSHNPACATYRTLLQIVLKVGQVEIAEHVLQHMIKMDNVNAIQQASFI